MDSEFDFVAASAIRKVVEDWVILRDSGRWDEFARVWHDDGWMTATWFQGPYAEFIAVSRSGFEHGVNIAHFLGGFSCEVAGSRAIAQTKMKIEQRAVVDGTEVDVTCSGRFYDFLELRAGRWAIVRRQPIYEKDRLDVVDPSASLKLDRSRLASFPGVGLLISQIVRRMKTSRQKFGGITFKARYLTVAVAGPNEGFTAAGTTTQSSSVTLPFPTIYGESSNYMTAESTWDDDDLFCSNGVGEYYTTWNYQFNSVSSEYGTPGAPIVAAGKCSQEAPNVPITYTTDQQSTWSTGASVSDDIGINLSSQDGWTGSSALTYRLKVQDAICGVNEPPGYVGTSPGFLQTH